MSDISKYSDLGTPLPFVLPVTHVVIKSYNKLCDNIISSLNKKI